MIKKIKTFLFSKTLNDCLEQENSVLRGKISELEELIGEPEAVVAKVLGRGIKWFDCTQLETEEQRLRYHRQAQDLLKNEVFINESNALVADCTNFCAKKSPNHIQTLGARMTINGIELLRQNIEGIDLEDGKMVKKGQSRLDALYEKHYG